MTRRMKYFSLVTTTLTFWSGMSAALDIGSNLYTYTISPTPEDSDKKALTLDWLTVGADLWGAFEDYERRENRF